MAAPLPPQARRFVALCTAGSMLAVAGCMDYVSSLTDQETILPRTPTMTAGFPDRWTGSNSQYFEAGTDVGTVRGGGRSAYVRTLVSKLEPGLSGVLGQTTKADGFQGARVRLSGWVRTAGAVSEPGMGLWLRVDGRSAGAFDNMSGRRIITATEWQEASIVADVPEDAIGLSYGVLSLSPGTVWIDDLRLEVVDPSTPLTAVATPGVLDTTMTIGAYQNSSLTPRNLDFEGVTDAIDNSQTLAWVQSKSFVFATDDPTVPTTDLDPLHALITNETIVGLGESTHGTREFQRMKHRMLEWLVREKGFSYFAIEASFVEALAVDRYVQTGEGDASEALRNLAFWTWNTDETLEMIEWMRAWNAAGNQPRVHFVGFDMQFPAIGMDSVKAFVKRMDPDLGTHVDDLYNCLDEFRSSVNPWTLLGQHYTGLPLAVRQACQASLKSVGDILASNESVWNSREGAEKVRLIKQFNVILQQWELAYSSPLGQQRSAVRDRSMADNVRWWHDVQVPGAKMVLWAHNQHVVKRFNSMGQHLAEHYGPSYFNVALTFAAGTFNAVLQGERTDTLPGQRIHTVPGLFHESIEAILNATGSPRLIFDARAVRGAVTPATEPLLATLAIRAIGAAYRQSVMSGYHVSLLLPKDYDLIVFFAQTTPTHLRTIPSTP